MSHMKVMFDYMFRTMDEFGMKDCEPEEILAFATGLKDGDARGDDYVYSPSSLLQSMYKQGRAFTTKGIDNNGIRIRKSNQA